MPERKRWRTRWQHGKEFAMEAWGRISQDRVPLAAGAISFFTLLSLMPLLIFALSIVPFFITQSQLETALAPEIAETLEREVLAVARENVVSGISFSLLFALWAGSQVFVMMESAMNLAWHSQKKRPVWVRRGLALLMVVIVGVLLAAALVVSNVIRVLARLEIPLWGNEVGDIPWLITILLSYLVPLLLISALFAVIYRILPTKKVTLRAVIPGAILAGGLWLISLHVFSWYAANFADYSVLYGSLGGLIFLMLWFYYSAFIMLLGAEVSAVYHRRLVEAGDREERLVEESERASEERREWQEYRQQMETAEKSTAYYGYRNHRLE